MIRGQNIDTLTVIRDTTAGRVSVWMMVIMLFMLYMLYLVVLYRMEMVRLERFVKLKHDLEQELSACRKRMPGGVQTETKPNGKFPSINIKKSENRESAAEDTETINHFNDLKHNHRRW